MAYLKQSEDGTEPDIPSNSTSNAKSRRRNKPSILLSEKENEDIFELLEAGQRTLSTAVVQLLLPSQDQTSWIVDETGVVCFIRDKYLKTYYIQVYSLRTQAMVFEQEIYHQFDYEMPLSIFLTFEGDNSMVGLNFADTEEATDFSDRLEYTLEKNRLRQNFRRSQSQPSQHQQYSPQISNSNEDDDCFTTASPVTLKRNSGKYSPVSPKPTGGDERWRPENKNGLKNKDNDNQPVFPRLNHVKVDSHKNKQEGGVDSELQKLFNRLSSYEVGEEARLSPRISNDSTSANSLESTTSSNSDTTRFGKGKTKNTERWDETSGDDNDQNRGGRKDKITSTPEFPRLTAGSKNGLEGDNQESKKHFAKVSSDQPRVGDDNDDVTVVSISNGSANGFSKTTRENNVRNTGTGKLNSTSPRSGTKTNAWDQEKTNGAVKKEDAVSPLELPRLQPVRPTTPKSRKGSENVDNELQTIFEKVSANQLHDHNHDEPAASGAKRSANTNANNTSANSSRNFGKPNQTGGKTTPKLNGRTNEDTDLSPDLALRRVQHAPSHPKNNNNNGIKGLGGVDNELQTIFAKVSGNQTQVGDDTGTANRMWKSNGGSSNASNDINKPFTVRNVEKPGSTGAWGKTNGERAEDKKTSLGKNGTGTPSDFRRAQPAGLAPKKGKKVPNGVDELQTVFNKFGVSD